MRLINFYGKRYKVVKNGDRHFTQGKIWKLKQNRNEYNDKLLRGVPKMTKKEKCQLSDIYGNKITKESLVSSIERNDGRMIKVMQELHLNYSTLSRYLQTDAKLMELQDYFRRKLLNKAEDVIVKCLSSKNEGYRFKAACFILETLGKDVYGKQPNVQVNVDQRQLTQKEKLEKINDIFGITKPSVEVKINNQIEDKTNETKEDKVIDLDDSNIIKEDHYEIDKYDDNEMDNVLNDIKESNN